MRSAVSGAESHSAIMQQLFLQSWIIFWKQRQ